MILMSNVHVLFALDVKANAATLTKFDIFQDRVIVCFLSRACTPEKLKFTMPVRGDDFGEIAERLVEWLGSATGAEVQYERDSRTGDDRDMSKRLGTFRRRN